MPKLFILAVLAMLPGCVSPGSILPGQDFTMTVGQSRELPGATRLHYAGTANDSRCPPNVQCIHAGDADVLFDVTKDGAPARITLNTQRARTADIGRWRLQLRELAPGESPRVTVRIDARDGAGQ